MICILLVMILAYQPPVIFVDSIGANNVNLSNQTITGWITNNESRIDTVEVEIDTLRLRCDTTDTEISTLDAYDDTLTNRIDSNDTDISKVTADVDSMQMMFFAWDDGGGQTIAATETDSILMDTEVIEDAVYAHAADAAIVRVAVAGTYHISYTVGVVKGDTDNCAAAVQRKTGGGAWSTIVASTASFSPSGYGTISKTFPVTLAANDSLQIILSNTSASNSITTSNDVVSLYIMRVK